MFCSGKEKTAVRQGFYGVRLTVKESICRKSVHTHQFSDEHRMSMRFALAGKCEMVNFVVAYAATDCAKHAEIKTNFWEKVEDVVEEIPTKECVFVLMDANARTGHGVVG